MLVPENSVRRHRWELVSTCPGMQACSDGESTGTGRDDATHTARDFAARTQQEATAAQTESEATAKVENRSVVWLP